MTLEEAIKRYTSNSFYEKSDGNLQGYLEFNQLAEWLKELKQLKEQTQWIPVSERLPEKNRAVLTYVDTGMTKTYCLAYWNDRVKGWEEWIGYRMLETEMEYKVLAWQPLPEAYKKGGE